MRYTIENDVLKAEFDSHGAELKSVINKATGFEYMWQADPAYWNRTSPVLFPFVGGVVNNEYRFEGQTYTIGQHGFARDSEFEYLADESDESSIWFSLNDSPETYSKYPFHFVLEVGYILKGNELTFAWKVTNPGQDRADKTLYFSIGGHPAFNCDFKDGNYSLYFEGAKEIHHHGNLNGTATREDLCLSLSDEKVVMKEDFFDRSTYIVENNQTQCIALISNGKQFVTVKFDAPLFGVWSPIGKKAPFVCLEPWYGRTDYDDFCGDLTEREFGNCIGENEDWTREYKVIFA